MIFTQLESTAASKQWNKIGIRHHHGITVSLFSLHSHTSSGIGEYPDLLPLLSWCHDIGFDTVQLLPLNDTGLESSPYSALSAYALNPIHLGLSQLPYVLQDSYFKQQWEALLSLNATQRIVYREVHEGKEKFLRSYYKQYRTKISSLTSYQQFKDKNNSWLHDYTVFKSLKILTDWEYWEKWPQEICTNRSEEIMIESEFHLFIQYLCFQQLEEVKRQATAQGIFIKGDIPILIDRESADVWKRKELFILDIVAGAPPDMYAIEGQKWGFPIYNWTELEFHGYDWWVKRLTTAAYFYHIYRLDHIVGFFRIWGIPLFKSSKEGFFIPQDEGQWIPQGEKLMHMMLNSCDMLPIGEDLGTIPPEVRSSLRSLGICGTKVMRWERRWNEDKGFIDPKDYPPESMTTVSTHDSQTLALWWRDAPDEAELYARTQGWEYTPELSPEQRTAILSASHHSASLFHINLLQEYLALIPGKKMIWPLLEDERINIPGTISSTNWTYKFRPSVEEIVNHEELATAIKELLQFIPK